MQVDILRSSINALFEKRKSERYKIFKKNPLVAVQIAQRDQSEKTWKKLSKMNDFFFNFPRVLSVIFCALYEKIYLFFFELIQQVIIAF